MSEITLEWSYPDPEGWHCMRATRRGIVRQTPVSVSDLPSAHPAKSLIEGRLADQESASPEQAEIMFDALSGALKVRPAFLAALDLTSAEALGLPPPLPLALDIKSVGAMLDPSFHVVGRFVSGGGAPARVEVKGALALYNGRTYRLPTLLLELQQAIEALGQPIADEAQRIEQLARLRSAIPAELAEQMPDGYIRDIRILYAASMSLSLIPEGDGMTFDPVLFGRSAMEASSGDDLIDEQAYALLTPAEQEAFAQHGFRNRPTARAAYSVGRNTFVYVDPALRPVLDLVRKAQDADPETRKRFALSPRTYIREALGDADETLADVLFIETEQFSQRVSGIDTWRKPLLPWIKPKANSWLPESFGFLLGDTSVNLTVELARKLYHDLTDAQSRQLASIEFEVEDQVLEIAVTEQAIANARELAALAERVDQEGHGKGSNGKDQVQDLKRFLVVKDNLDVETYTEDAVDRGGRPAFKLELPACLRTSLKKHQVEGVEWLEQTYDRDLPGALLADDMGLGKTLQALGVLAWRWEKGCAGQRPAKPSLIVAPTGLLNNWRDEIERHLDQGAFGDIELAFGPHLKRLRKVAGGNDTSLGASTLDVSRWMQAGLVMTTFETLRDYHLSFARVPFAMVVFDEAQKAKNPASQVTRAAKTLNAELKLAMTGTPVENRLQDLWSITDVVWAGRLGSSQGFAKTYPETETEKLKALNRDIREPGPSGRPPFMLRRLKRDKLDGLPSKTIRRYETPMPPAQAEAYRRAVVMAVAGRAGMSAGDGMLRTLHELRQLSLHPGSDEADTSLEAWAQNSARTKVLLSILDEVQAAGEKALIFVEFLDAQERLTLLLERRFGFRPDCINGSTPGDRRQAIVRRFQDGKRAFDALILSPKAGGVGLTLTAANHVIHLTRWWNPAVEDQATDRVYRIGQLRPVTVHLPIAVHPDPALRATSFDLKLDALLERKRALSEDLLMPVEGEESDIRGLFEGVLDTSTESISTQPPKVAAQSASSGQPATLSAPSPKVDSHPTPAALRVKGRTGTLSLPSSTDQPQNIWRKQYAPGQPRSVGEILKPLAAKPILTFELQDPYCMTANNRPHLVMFLKQMLEHLGPVSLSKIRAWSPEARKIREQSSAPESEAAAKYAFNQAFPNDLRCGARIVLDLVKRPDRDFHDRWAKFQVGVIGRSTDYVLDLSGGVDRLMQSHREIVATLARVD